MGVTTNFSFPYPALTDAPDGPSQIEALAEAVDAELETIVSGLPYPVVTAFKASDTSRSSTTSLTADPDLSLAVAASATYVFEGYLDYEGGTEGASDLQIEMHSVGTLRFQLWGSNTSLATIIGQTFQGSASIALGSNGASNLRGASMKGTVINASGAGTLFLSWAQNSSNSTATILHAGSWISLRRIA
jgi:hypothetical protein